MDNNSPTGENSGLPRALAVHLRFFRKESSEILFAVGLSVFIRLDSLRTNGVMESPILFGPYFGVAADSNQFQT